MRKIKNDDGSLNGHCAYSYEAGVPMWVVAKDKGLLQEASEYEDLWSKMPNIPPIVKIQGRESRTVITVPLTGVRDNFGVLYLESSAFLEPNPRAQQELQALSEGLGILYQLVEENEGRQNNTSEALSSLRSVLDREKEFKLTKPSLFFAYSSRADQDVTGNIETVLDEFEKYFNLIDWRTISKSGEINQQVMNAIQSSKYAVCYFSEPTKGDGSAFQDNPNVLFEAGMIHALSSGPRAVLKNWIPIREKESPDIPFDFATLRVLHVPRNKQQSLNEHRFSSQLRKRITSLIDDELELR